MKKNLLLLILFVSFFVTFAQNPLNVNVGGALIIPNKNDINGVNMANMWSYISGDNIDNIYKNCKISEPIMAQLKNLSINNYRFPGGTISNYYHYYGKNGYGGDSLEFVCKENYFYDNSMKTRLENDKAFDVNFIVPFADAMVKLKNEGQAIKVNYVLNLFTHISSKQLSIINPTILSLFNTHGASFSYLKSKKLRNMDSLDLQNLKTVFIAMTQDSKYNEMKTYFLSNNAFTYNLNENLDALKYLKSRNISVNKIELGNELYSEILLFDDDLSEVGYDCFDTITEPFDKGDFKGINLFEAFVKYYLMCDIYMTKIKEFSQPDFAVIGAPSNANVYLVNGKYKIEDNFSIKSKINYVWNICLNQVPTKAVIDHNYAQSFSDCSKINNTNIDLLFTTAAGIYNFYTDSLYAYDLLKTKKEFPNKDIWVTEWNIGNPDLVGNTLLHLAFANNQIGNLVKQNTFKKIPITNAVYHLMSAQASYNYALIRTGYYGGSTYKDTLQLMQFAFDLWKDVFNQNYKYLAIDKTEIFKANANSLNDLSTHLLFTTNNTLSLFFSNTGEKPIKFIVSDLNINYNNVKLYVTKKEIKYLNGQKLYSSDRNCDTEKGQYNIQNLDYFVNDYKQINVDTILIPPFSVGKINLYLSTTTGINTENTIKAKIFPNPASRQIFIDLEEPNDNLQIKMINIIGEEVFKQKFGNYRKASIAPNLESGIYLLILEDNFGKIKYTHKVIIK